MSIKIIRKFQLDSKMWLKRDLIEKDCLKWCFTNTVWSVALQFALFYRCYCISFQPQCSCHLHQYSLFPHIPSMYRGKNLKIIYQEEKWWDTASVWWLNKGSCQHFPRYGFTVSFLVHSNKRNDEVWHLPWCFPDLFSWF